MATSCVEWLNWKDLRSILESGASSAKEQGRIGEVAAHLVAQELLGLQETPFRPADNGFDNVMRDQDGKLVLVEVKTSHTGYPLNLLGDEKDAPKMGSQLEETWIRKTAERMMDKNSSYHADNPANETLGREILQTMDRPGGVDNFRRILIHIDPETHGIDHYEMINNRWQRIMSYSGKDMEERLKPHGH